MELRSHHLMNYRGIANWPPAWNKMAARANGPRDVLRGEVGVLERVLPSRTEPDLRVFLVIKFDRDSYMGTLLFRDAAFCRHITKVLQARVGKTVKEIGDLDLSYTLGQRPHGLRRRAASRTFTLL